MTARHSRLQEEEVRFFVLFVRNCGGFIDLDGGLSLTLVFDHGGKKRRWCCEHVVHQSAEGHDGMERLHCRKCAGMSSSPAGTPSRSSLASIARLRTLYPFRSWYSNNESNSILLRWQGRGNDEIQTFTTLCMYLPNFGRSVRHPLFRADAARLHVTSFTAIVRR